MTDQLLSEIDNNLAENYILANNIPVGKYSILNVNSNFTSIRYSNGFTKMLDGYGYTISGLRNYPYQLQSRIIQRHAPRALIQNATVTGRIDKSAGVGEIVGYADSATIKECKNEAKITGSSQIEFT